MQRDQAHRTNELLERIAKALEKDKSVTHADVHNAKYNNDIPGFEGTLEELHNLKLHTDEGEQEDDHVHNDYLEEIVKDMNHIQYLNFHHEMAFGFPSSDTAALSQHIYELEYEEVLGAIRQALFIKGDSDYVDAVECSGFDKERKDKLDGYANLNHDKYADDPNLEVQLNQDDPYTYDNELREYHCGVVNDSDFNIRKTAYSYEAALDSETQYTSKKDCILDYITNEFGILGARYTDIIKFAYYLGSPNALKYTSADRGYYSCAFNTRFGGHLIQGGKDCLVKGINNEGDERYFAFSFVEQATDYWRYTDNRSAR